mmetsp:Transcript_99314/g.206874  ORF Transcript_99314/g.206874 Transcript_99314/m.206874 type:complete len:284 (+) Transcript_99314:99-950(+)|eukprot:CAMPEP_0206458256 /NCGR_PEP_ID=MMETSP0324_2-20121206/23458_1 /ASSEMBLY_ACC=CAM_ASM_000836 /TAXON_ID=2866 /ORGANISM="Crypthecodinium cohnii, Strain Seligo" /LENGTH=283 /DNA_ID=CAMNT_0053929553 /DNA_START=69 /DNA_END=920 /DNA_ORIENTATION=+
MAIYRVAMLAAAGYLSLAAVAEKTCKAGQPGCVAEDHLLLQTRNKNTKLSTGVADKPYEQCEFVVAPDTPYYWEEDCTFGMLGCFADGVNNQCRFCNYHHIECPMGKGQTWFPQKQCQFDNEPTDVSYYYEPLCTLHDQWEDQNFTGFGCRADNKTWGCRFCGGDGSYSNITCPQTCTFPNKPSTPYYWNPDCKNGQLGCLADGIHEQCSFCGKRPFQSITCPDDVEISDDSCFFMNEPTISYQWNATCYMGALGCLADGIHNECQFCGAGAFADIPCVNTDA